MKLKSLVSAAFLFTAIPAVASEATMTVFKSPTCGCCVAWVEALEDAGYSVEVQDLNDLTMIKKNAGVSDEMASCHTGVLNEGGRKYVVEGHVPLEALAKLRAEQPDIHGLAVPGMPMGSLGMGHDPSARYDVMEISPGKEAKVFMQMGSN